MKKIILLISVALLLLAFFYFFQKKEAKVLFVGDMMFDRYIRQVGNKKGEDFIFSCSGLSNFLKDFDLVVGNLEGPITNNQSVSLGSVIDTPENYTFTFPPSTAKLLAKNNIKLLNLGNNHINNFGQAGIDSTKNYLNEAGINYFINYTIYRTKIGGRGVSFISYTEFSGESAQETAQKILEEKNNGRTVIVYAHWGEEYVSPTTQVKKLAHLFIDAGAEMIVGSHPHIIQESEIYNGKQIYYSLGNFIFDQYWNGSVSTGLVLEAQISGREIKVTEHRVSLNKDGRTCLMSSN